jgi:uncharacterized protein YybS (DUF2232 family)
LEREKRLFFNNGMIRGIAVLTLTLLAVALIPFVGPIVVIMTPLPILYYCFRLGSMQGLAALAVAFLLASGILNLLGRPAHISAFIIIGITGVMLSETLKRRYSLEKTFAIASLMLFFCGVGFVLYHALQASVAPWRMVEMYIESTIKDNLALYAQMNISEDQMSMLRENTVEITRFFTDIFPGLTLCGAILTVWLNVLAGRSLFRRDIGGFPDFGDLSLWKAPEKLVWLLIVSGSMTLAPIEILDTIGINVLIVCCLIYLFQGLAIAAFFFRQKQVPVIFRGLFYMLIAVQQYMIIFIIAVGLSDLWIDFRKRITGIKDAHV